MLQIINVHEAKTHFSKLLNRVMNGEEIIIAKAGKPVARMLPITEDLIARVPGSAVGRVWISPDFNAPLPEDMIEEFEK